MKTYITVIFTFLILLMSKAQKFDANPEYDYLVTISTDFGQIKLILFEDTPMHRENFLMLTEMGAYTGCIFHRVINNFMIQGGDLATRNEPLTPEMQEINKNRIPAEILPNHAHNRGVVAAARQGDQVNPYRMSSPTQFYIVQNPNGAHHLDGAYTVFGVVLNGMDVVDMIAAQEVGAASKPVLDIRMAVAYQKMKKSEISKVYNYTYL